MAKKKSSKKQMLYFLPFAIQIIIHIVATLTERNGSSISIWQLVAATIATLIAMGLGEGYGSIAFIVAGYHDHFAVYVTVIVLSIVSAVASLIGFTFSGIEGIDCLWMTMLFWCTDIFLFVFSIIRIVKLSATKRKAHQA